MVQRYETLSRRTIRLSPILTFHDMYILWMLLRFLQKLANTLVPYVTISQIMALIDIYSSTIILHIYRLVTVLKDTSRLFWCGLCSWDKFIILKY